MQFTKLATYLDELEQTSSRLAITEILARLFTETSADEIDQVVYLLLGRLAPSYEGIVFNIADKLMVAAVASAFDLESAEVMQSYKRTGDIGETAYELSTKKSASVSVSEVYTRLLAIAEDEGEGSVERKVSAMAGVMRGVDKLSAKFVARIPVGKLRLGFSDKTIIDALSWFLVGDKSQSKHIEQAYYVTPDVGRLAKAVKKGGLSGLSSATPVVGVPVLPMLAQRLKSPDEMVKKMGQVAVESKLDGLRIQIHFKSGGFKNGSKVRVYTRNLNNTSWMFPELREMGKFVRAKEIILDTEAVGLDEETKKMANFQTTMSRRRKHDIAQVSQKIGITFWVFDVISSDGKSYMNLPYTDRRELLGKLVIPGKLFQIVDSKLTTNPHEIAQSTKDHQAKGLEGIMVKKADSGYVPGRTGWRWVKMKEQEDSVAKLVDTLDCVVMGYTQGKGKRSGFGIGQFLAGIRDGERIKTITKVGTGLTDEQFKELKKRLVKLEVKTKPKEYDVHKDLTPDFWVTPDLVVELATDELTVSPKHTSGFAMRFPRLVRFRDEKTGEQAETLSEVKKLYKLQ